MPELPEVEVCRLGISPHIDGQTVKKVTVRHKQLRWPIPEEVLLLNGLTVLAVNRRSKYLLIEFTTGTLVLHLGMSGTIRVIDEHTPVAKHDHFDLAFTHGKVLRLNDPRRFGAVLWLADHQDEQGLFTRLGPEPLSDAFASGYLFEKAKNKRVAIKSFLMNNHVVVGVGNIYANEALFLAGISPLTIAGDISEQHYDRLTDIIKQVLAAAIEQGGTTLKDFTQADGRPGYFAQKLLVYGRSGKPCVNCQTPLHEVRQSNRSSVFCPQCQPVVSV
ncbi:bifunctional DNA-formamidopyrimidine glycosylase/DNA-(apurinic or apyrimidinic site) lyase [Thalassotalea sp. PP2-459]|uniref:bifunctional DNA-formamidopyrimidine glycosylase/DNA-(apurinic or apyrimidinic site) lyase n=1 Tax=Thalassotalea sp. PP2-459 TaxID=1742724 RepID=UPI0009420619|nr:bifunctional DNA-formamidopyrimidine glycosylase/DNA-(apurinic or apyrimidinic site) lyase [Thalassotalea sp. PP2-459]OKY26644.1 DNA-formamidopyrimidine glycosylase [Thalassotalea sp. PP2-459]